MATRASKQQILNLNQRGTKTTQFDHLAWRTRFTDAESVVIERGLTPRSSDDKWDVSFEANTLLFRRSGTGFIIYRVHVKRIATGLEVVGVDVCSDASQYRRGSDAYERAFLNWLIRELMLGQGVAMPMPDALRSTWKQRLSNAIASVANVFRPPPPSEAELEAREQRFVGIARDILQSRYGRQWVPEFLFRMTNPDGDYFTTARADGTTFVDSPGSVFVFSEHRNGVILDPLIDAIGSYAQGNGSSDALVALKDSDPSNPAHVDALSAVVRHSLMLAGASGAQPEPPVAAPAVRQERLARLMSRQPAASPARERFSAMLPFLGLVTPFDSVPDPGVSVLQFAWVDGSLRRQDAVVVTLFARSGAFSIQTEVVRGFGMGEAGVRRHNRTRVITFEEYEDLSAVLRSHRLGSMPMEAQGGALDGSFWLLQMVGGARSHVVVRNSPRETSDAAFRNICKALLDLSSVPEPRRRDILG